MTISIATDLPNGDAVFNNPHTNVVTIWVNPQIWIYVVTPNNTGATGFKIFRSTDGGLTYTTTTLSTSSGIVGPSIWYDRWTPGNDTGDIIHILGASSSDETLRYFSWNAANNLPGTLSNIVIATHTSISGAAAAGDGGTSICKSANGSLYASVKVTTTVGWYVYQSTNNALTWSDITAQGSSVNTAMNQVDDQLLLIPCSTVDDIMAIEFDNSTNFLQYQIYDDSANSWSAATQIEDRFCGGDGNSELTPCPFNATIDKTTSNIYLVFSDGSASHIYMEKFTTSTGKWTPLHPILENRQGESASLNYQITGVSIQRDQINGVLTVWYCVGGGANTDYNGIFYRHSSDDGMSWGAPQFLTQSTSDLRYIAAPLIINNINEGWYCVFTIDNTDDLLGADHDIGAGGVIPFTFQYSRVYGNVKDSLGNNVVGAEVSVFREQPTIHAAAGAGGPWSYQGNALTDSNGNYFIHVANYYGMYNYIALVNYDSCRKSVFPNSRIETSLAAGTLYASKFTGLTIGDKIKQVTINYTENPPTAFDIRVKAYDDSSGSPNNLLGETGVISIPKKLYFERAIHVINFPTPITVPSSGIVWIAFETSVAKTMYLKNGETSGTTKTVTHTFGSGPNPFGSPTNQTYGIWISITGDTKVDASIGDVING